MASATERSLSSTGGGGGGASGSGSGSAGGAGGAGGRRTAPIGPMLPPGLGPTTASSSTQTQGQTEADVQFDREARSHQLSLSRATRAPRENESDFAAGSKEKMLANKASRRASDQEYRASREAGGGGMEDVREDVLMGAGDEDSFAARIRARDAARARGRGRGRGGAAGVGGRDGGGAMGVRGRRGGVRCGIRNGRLWICSRLWLGSGLATSLGAKVSRSGFFFVGILVETDVFTSYQQYPELENMLNLSRRRRTTVARSLALTLTTAILKRAMYMYTYRR